MESRFNTLNQPSFPIQFNCILCYWDKDEVCRFGNQQFCKWFGRTASELIDKVTFKVLMGADYYQHQSFLLKVFEGNFQVNEYEMQSYSGDTLNVIATYYPDIHNKEVIGFFLHIADKNIINHNAVININSFNIPLEKPFLNIEGDANKMYRVASHLKSLLFSGFPRIEDLAKSHFMSVSKLMRDFKQTFKTSPYFYYRSLQMEFAERYFKETGCNKKQMSLMLGFSNPANFTSCYKRYLKGETDRRNGLVNDLGADFVNKLFIKQLPIAIAIVDKNMNYLGVSDQWLVDFKLVGVDLIGENLFDLFPDRRNKWRKIQMQCLKGETNKCDEGFFVKADGKKYWLKWEIKPWFDLIGRIGGLIICAHKLKNYKDLIMNS